MILSKGQAQILFCDSSYSHQRTILKEWETVKALSASEAIEPMVKSPLCGSLNGRKLREMWFGSIAEYNDAYRHLSQAEGDVAKAVQVASPSSPPSPNNPPPRHPRASCLCRLSQSPLIVVFRNPPLLSNPPFDGGGSPSPKQPSLDETLENFEKLEANIQNRLEAKIDLSEYKRHNPRAPFTPSQQIEGYRCAWPRIDDEHPLIPSTEQVIEDTERSKPLPKPLPQPPLLLLLSPRENVRPRRVLKPACLLLSRLPPRKRERPLEGSRRPKLADETQQLRLPALLRQVRRRRRRL